MIYQLILSPYFPHILGESNSSKNGVRSEFCHISNDKKWSIHHRWVFCKYLSSSTHFYKCISKNWRWILTIWWEEVTATLRRITFGLFSKIAVTHNTGGISIVLWGLMCEFRKFWNIRFSVVKVLLRDKSYFLLKDAIPPPYAPASPRSKPASSLPISALLNVEGKEVKGLQNPFYWKLSTLLVLT